MLWPDTGVVANVSVAHAAPDQGASQTHWEAVQTPDKEQSKSVEHGVPVGRGAQNARHASMERARIMRRMAPALYVPLPHQLEC